MEITPISFTNIGKIEAEYLSNLEENRLKGTVSKAHPIDATWKVPTTIRN